MGGGYYDRDDSVPVSNSGSVVQNTSSSVVGKTSGMQPGLDPKRWKDQNLTCDKGDPVVFALDVTGSMGEWTKIIYDKMPMFYGQIMMQKYLQDPAISFCAIGDAKTDNAPLQVSEFGQGKEIDQLISKMWLEGNGGGNEHESYEMSAYFYGRHCSFSNARLPFFFVTGDEGYWETTTSEMIERVMGIGVGNINGASLWKDLMKKFNVFHIKKAYYSGSEPAINKQWCDTLGSERVLHITNPKACIDVMLGAIALTSGSRTLDEYVKDMQIREQTKERIKEVSEALAEYAKKLTTKEIIPVNATNEQFTSKQEKNFDALREITEKLLLTTLDNEEDKEYYNGIKTLGKTLKNEIPKEMLCPITGELFWEPVIAADGQTYEKLAIESWLTSSDVSPLLDTKLENKDVIPNLVLKKLIKEFYNKNK